MNSTKPNGYGTLTLGESTYPFHVGLNQSEVYCDLRKVSLKEYNEAFAPQRLQEQKLSAGELRDFVYSSLVAGAQVDGLEVDFTNLDVGNWIDEELDATEVTKPLNEMLNQLVRRATRQAERLKNAEAPQAGPAKKAKQN